MNILNILPKGYGTYIMVFIGIVGIWGAYALAATGVWTEAPAALAKACGALPTDADAVLLAACEQVKAGPLTISGAVGATWAALTAAFIRRGIASA